MVTVFLVQHLLLLSINNFLIKKKKTYEELNINSENIYSSIVKIGTSDDNQSGAGFFINNDTILTNYHVLEKFYQSKPYADLDIWDTVIRSKTSPYCFSINKKFIERIGINDSCPTDYLLLEERIDQKNCLSKSGNHETLVPVNVSCDKDYVQIEETDVQIILIDGHKILGYVIEADKNLDIVAIRIKSEFRDSYNYLEFHTGPVPEEKSTVFAIGHPFGLEYTETDGTISAYRDNNKKRIFDKKF